VSTVDPAVQRRVLLVLAGTQVLDGVGVAIALAVATLIAARLSGAEVLGGFALTSVVLGTAATELLISRVAARVGATTVCRAAPTPTLIVERECAAHGVESLFRDQGSDPRAGAAPDSAAR
jgi:hypothetical protein